MKEALIAQQSGVIGSNEIARKYKRPNATSKRIIDDKNKNVHGSGKKFGRTADLPPEIEEEMVNNVLQFERSLFGITRSNLRKLAYAIAEKNTIPCRFKNGQADKKWYYCFITRPKELSLHQPVATTEEKVKAFFDCVTALHYEHDFGPSEISKVYSPETTKNNWTEG
ncbi:hypothetical protein JTB14_037905 [Gonioctena quinquepunctata]|nr:hypothetical protein JTB14_037905 [Gonioctena quinquepunctata]